MRELLHTSQACDKCDGATCGCVQRKPIAPRRGDAQEQDADRMATRMRGAAVPHTDRPVAGGPLPAEVRAPFEERLGFDFSRVRIHADDAAARAAGRLDAHAFTVANDIYFGARQFAPHSAAGSELLAHELVHTVQQRGGGPTVQRKSAGGCADTDDVDEKHDELRTAGKKAHEQIQAAFSAVLEPEAKIPRASKEGGRVGTKCPKKGTPAGFADLFGYIAGDIEIGEIKSVEGAQYARDQVIHYLRRSGEATDRILQKKHPMCPGPAEDEDREFDNRYLAGSTQRGNDPNLKPLQTFMPQTPVWLGPFKHNPRKHLYCKGSADGSVLYWCTKKRRKRDKRKEPFKYVVDQPAVRDKKRIHVVDYDHRFHDLFLTLPGARWLEGSRLLFAVSQELYDGVLGADAMARTLRLMTIDMRNLPIYNFRTITWGTLGVICGAATIAILAVAAAEAIPLGLAAEAGAEAGTGVTAATATTEAIETTEGAIEVVDATTTGIEVVDATATTAAATTTAAAGAAETIPLWMTPAAQEFAKQAAAGIMAVLIGAQMSERDASAAALAALKNKHVFTVVDATNAPGLGGVGTPVTAAGEKFRVIGEMKT